MLNCAQKISFVTYFFSVTVGFIVAYLKFANKFCWQGRVLIYHRICKFKIVSPVISFGRISKRRLKTREFRHLVVAMLNYFSSRYFHPFCHINAVAKTKSTEARLRSLLPFFVIYLTYSLYPQLYLFLFLSYTFIVSNLVSFKLHTSLYLP